MTEAVAEATVRLQSRAYQLEMFTLSMEQNIIVAVLARLISQVYELRRSCNEHRSRKKVWFTTPNVVLAHQQYDFLSSQLPQYRCRTLLGDDKVDLWLTQSVWDKALDGVNIIICTPQVLLDALCNAFVALAGISLLVIDEAHHCHGDASIARIMLGHYHPQKELDRSLVPHILGMTASPQINAKRGALQDLESTLDAICKSPTRSIHEYKQFIHLPMLVRLDYHLVFEPMSNLFSLLERIVLTTFMGDDPYYRRLLSMSTLASRVELEKIADKQTTPAMKELKTLLGHAEHLHNNIGSDASDRYIKSCVHNWHDLISVDGAVTGDSRKVDPSFVNARLSPIRSFALSDQWCDEHVSSRALALIRFLESEYHEGLAVVIFVQRRTMAHALCQLLQRCPRLSQYRIFSFVGLATSRRQSLFEISDMRAQREAFAEFRAGARDICVATSVAEEGIDIQAVNLVIRYDEPQNFIAYVQSRGRARRKDSKFVYFPPHDSKPAKYDAWTRLESDMKAQYQDDMRVLAEREANEDIDEDKDEIYTTPLGALLNYSNSLAHLQHFCATLSTPGDPIMVLSGRPTKQLSARAVLPSCLAPELQQFSSSYIWRTEKMARKDAAFQAVKAIHMAGLIDDHLMPPRPEKIQKESVRHGTRLYEICDQTNVWQDANQSDLCKYRVHISHDGETYAPISIFLPAVLDHTLHFQLSENPSRLIDVRLELDNNNNSSDLAKMKEFTSSLFAHVFDQGSACSSLTDEERIALVLVPDHDKPLSSDEPIPMHSCKTELQDLSNHQSLLVWTTRRRRPFIWRTPRLSGTLPSQVSVVKVSKVRLFTSATGGGALARSQTGETLLETSKLFVRPHSSLYGPTLLLIPSILEIFAAALRAQEAKSSIFGDLCFKDSRLLTYAFLANSAAGVMNYERLEFLGDALLKFHASLNMYYDHPLGTEGVLTTNVHRLVSNMRLEKVSLDLGLEKYITTRATPQKHWALPKVCAEAQPRKVQSKTLADVVESTLAATFLDVRCQHEAEARVVRALCLFIPEVEWRTAAELVSSTPAVLQNFSSIGPVPQIMSAVSDMLDYTFRNPSLLLEALTHSHRLPGRRSLDRLEFLGDAILDRIVKHRLFNHTHLSPDRMSLCGHAVTSHAVLAYFALSIQTVKSEQEIITIGPGKIRLTEKRVTTRLVELVIFAEPASRKHVQSASANYDGVCGAITRALEQKQVPWTILHSLNAPKVVSDVIESLIAAVFIDSGASLEACERVIHKIGLLDLLDEVATNQDFEVQTPKERLYQLSGSKHVEITSSSRETNGGQSEHTAQVRVDDELICEVVSVKGREEAESKAADVAIHKLTARHEVVYDCGANAIMTTDASSQDGSNNDDNDNDHYDDHDTDGGVDVE